DIVDYPGEWLLDLGLMPQSYAEWSVSALASARQRPEAATFLAWVDAQNASEPFDETVAIEGAQIFAAYLKAAKAAGRSGVAPGRFLLPGEMEGAPALTFMPLPSEAAGPLAAECARRFEAYKRVVVRPFFRDHFGRLDRQIVLVDLLSAVGQGPESLRDLQETLTGILGAFRPGASSWLAPLLGRRVDKLLLAVTKADHIHHESHPALNALVRDLLARTIDRAAFRGAEVDAMALAGVRATVEDTVREGGEALPAVRGRLLDTGREAVLFPGEPPETLAALKQGGWDTTAFDAHAFAPPRLEKREDEGPPHVRLDRAAEFLFGDKLA
ncbi:MAG: YcjX family protein, partial [Pseudomonadota bacterium]